MQWRFEHAEPSNLATKAFCLQCHSRIAAVGDGGSIECAICDFANATMILSDAIAANSIRLRESANRFKIALDYF